MTEAEWLACNDPKPMLEFLRGKAGDRKLWLYAAACFRRIRHGTCWAKGQHVLHSPQGPDKLERAIATTEQYGDGAVS